MCERRALLDPDMYKISEEDSQDEEVLSSLNKFSMSPTKERRIENGNNTNNNPVSISRRNPSSKDDSSLLSNSLSVTNSRLLSSSSMSKHRRHTLLRNPVSGIDSASISRKHKELMRVLGSSRDSVEWPSSTSTSSGSSDSGTDSEDSDNMTATTNTLTVVSHTNAKRPNGGRLKISPSGTCSSSSSVLSSSIYTTPSSYTSKSIGDNRNFKLPPQPSHPPPSLSVRDKSSVSDREKRFSQSSFLSTTADFTNFTAKPNSNNINAKLTNQCYENMETETDGEDDEEELMESSSGSESCSSCSRSQRHRSTKKHHHDSMHSSYPHQHDSRGSGGSSSSNESIPESERHDPRHPHHHHHHHHHHRRNRRNRKSQRGDDGGSFSSDESYSSSSGNEEREPTLQTTQMDYEDDGEDYSYDRDDAEDEDFQIVTESEIEFTTNEDGSVVLFETRLQPTESIYTDSHVSSANVAPSSSVGSHQSQLTNPSRPQTEFQNNNGNASGMYNDDENRAPVKSRNSSIKEGRIFRFLKRGSRTKTADSELKHDTSRLLKPLSNSSSNKSKGKGNGKPERSAPAAGKFFRFKDEHEGEIRNVELSIGVWNKYKLGRRATLSETLLGIITGRFSSPPAFVSANNHSHNNGSTPADSQQSNPTTSQARTNKWDLEDNRIMVAGFIPDGVAVKSRHIKIGDWLQSINGRQVNFENLDAVLNSIVQNDEEEVNEDRDNLNTEPQLKIQIVLQRVAGCTVTEPEKPPRKMIHKYLENKGVTTEDSNRQELRDLGPDDELAHEILSNVAIIYVTTGTSSAYSHSPIRESVNDVIFSWPKDIEPNKVKALADSQGMFSTLFRMLKDVTGSFPIQSKVITQDELMDVNYWSDNGGESVLLFALSANVANSSSSLQNIQSNSNTADTKSKTTGPEKQLSAETPVSHRIMNRLKNTIIFKYGSLSRAFTTNNATEMDSYLSKNLAYLSSSSNDHLFSEVPKMTLNLRPHIQYPLDELLYRFETSDFYFKTLTNGSKSDETQFHCLGSCLLYKGVTIVSHLESDLAVQFHGWWKIELSKWVGHRGAESTWEPVKRLVIWQKTYPCTGIQSPSLAKPCAPHPLSECYAVLVGIDYYLLGFILEPATPIRMYQSHKPNILWIQKALNTVMRLVHQELDSDLESRMNLTERDFVELLPAQESEESSSTKNKNRVANAGTSGNKGTGGSGSSPSGTVTTNSILKNLENFTPASDEFGGILASGSTGSVSSSSSLKNVLMGQSGTMGSNSNSLSSNGQGSNSLHDDVMTGFNSNLSHMNAFGFSSESTRNDETDFGGGAQPGDSDVDEDEIDDTTTGSDASSFKWSGYATDRFGTDDAMKSISVTKGKTLFNFIQIEYGRGIILTSKGKARCGPHSVILQNFRHSTSITHNILHKAVKARQRLGDQESDKKWVSKALAPICEHGTLFQCQLSEAKETTSKKRRSRLVTFWVVGRVYPDQREVYVCYQDTPISQNMIEIAFKLAHNAK